MSVRKPLTLGDAVPDVVLYDIEGQPVSLQTFLGETVAVIFFYPADESPICTREACQFRDAYEDFVSCGAKVVGISADSEASHRKFASHHRLPFVLLSDHEGQAARAFGLGKTLGVLPSRTTFVVDHQGRIRLTFQAQMASKEHVERALKTVQELTRNT